MNSTNLTPHRVMERFSTILGVVALFAISVSGSADTLVNWALYENCPASTTTNEIPCGDYGSFYVNETGPAGCLLIEDGSEIPPRYYPNINVQDFPAEPVQVASRSDESRSFGPLASFLPEQNDNDSPAIPVFVSVIDFSGAHGNSVEWLMKEVAGNVSTRKFLLDSNEQGVATGVSDLEVLGQLCGVSEYLKQYGAGYQSIVNMSFGRALNEDDPVDGVACQDDRLNCQIKKVIEHLHEKGAVLVGAAGKQREAMFPAALDNVIATGMINPSEFKDQATTQPTWEMPDAWDALMPGSSLCIRGGWAAPAGASYSSAILSGWLAQSLAENPSVSLQEEGHWVPHLSADRQCLVLAQNGNEFTQCNAVIDGLFSGLAGGYANHCWATGSGEIIQASVKTTPNSQPLTTGAIQWDPLVRPSPEGDPCVPCTGGSLLRVVNSSKAPPADFDINLSHTEPFPDDIVVDAVHLRLGSAFHLIDLSVEQLTQIKRGNVARLTLTAAAQLVERADSASLFFSLRDKNALNCLDVPDEPPACVWISTHIHVP